MISTVFCLACCLSGLASRLLDADRGLEASPIPVVTTAAVAREIKGKRVFGFEDLGSWITMSSAPLFIYGRLLGIFSEIVFYMK